jgi:ADP-ribose pyrophosphatase YjhB (NUDIX family)
MKKAVDYTGVCIVHFCHDGTGRVIMNQRSEKCRDEHGKWDIGGGGLKYGEILLDAVKRELKEEYGAEAINIEPLGFREVIRQRKNGEKTHWIAFDYKVLVDPKKVYNAEPEKHLQVGWFTKDTLPSPLHSQLSHFLEKYNSLLFNQNA